MKFDYLIEAARHAYGCCSKEINNNGELFYDVYLAYDTDFSNRVYVFHELNDEKLVNWIEETYYDYVVETNKIGNELESLKIWQFINEDSAVKYPRVYEGARKAFKINGEWIYRYPRRCTPEAQITFNLEF